MRSPNGDAAGGFTAFDLLASARYWNQDAAINLNVRGKLTADIQADFERVGLD